MLRSILLVTDSGTGRFAESPIAFDDVALPFAVLRGAEARVAIATPTGDGLALSPPSVPEHLAGRLGEARAAMRETLALRDVDLADFGAIFVTHVAGGPGALESDADLRALLAGAAGAGSVVATVGNGAAALLGVRTEDGDAYLEGRRVTVSYGAEGDPERERSFARRFEAAGAEVVLEPARREHVTVDSTLVTGQNPSSAVAAASIVLTFLESLRARRIA